MNADDRILIRGLEAWRRLRLERIEAEMRELAEDFRAAQDGLGIAYRNPDQVERDIVEHLWDKLNRAATELAAPEKIHQQLMEMDISHLLVTFQRSKKKKMRPWEAERWELQLC